ncbi:hypothetical protein EYF80_009011 [Liparis tanakae]|uniref:Uncharacterized protein n=1 Tax=Liparis tanakae TaxID=230148 RepID=A0A4Z2ISN5_9TELE|nr:hypothetical protein EYF80_009011 [Liparis tanakae]
MFTSVENIRVLFVNDTKRDDGETETQKDPRPVSFMRTHCPAGWGWPASCTALRLGRGREFGQTAADKEQLTLLYTAGHFALWPWEAAAAQGHSSRLGRSCISLREASGGVWEGLLLCVFEARVARGWPGSRVKASSVTTQALWVSEQGITDMEMERPWVLLGCSGAEGRAELGGRLMGENTSLARRGSELETAGLGSPPVKEQERAAVRRERSSELEPRRLMLSCNSELELCRKPSTEGFSAAACRRRGGQKCCSHQQNLQIVTRTVTQPDRSATVHYHVVASLCWTLEPLLS